MSMTCPHCGRDIQTDDELYQEVVEELNITPMSDDTKFQARRAIELLNSMLHCGVSHTDRSKKIVEEALESLEE